MEKPTPPGDYDCCESGCEPCVWDIYQTEMALWRTAEAKRLATEAESAVIAPESAATS